MTMNCPVCAVPLTMSTRQNVEIDYCPQCRGVWLDRGELDKIIERSAAELAPTAQEPLRPTDDRMDYRQPHYGHGDHHRRKRKKSFLEELFD
jgi:Zn-finger nucleic acid-binding protein